MAIDGDEAVYYTSCDYKSLAYRTQSLFKNKEFCIGMGAKARAKHMKEHNMLLLVNNQIKIYKDIVG